MIARLHSLTEASHSGRVDISNVGAVALAAGGSSMVRLVQRIGRGVRKKNDVSNFCPIWFPIDPSNKFCKQHSLERLDYLDRCHIKSEEVNKNWLDTLKELELKYG